MKNNKIDLGFGKTTGLLESLIATSIIYSPNLLFAWLGLEVILLLYNYAIMFVLIAIMMFKKYA